MTSHDVELREGFLFLRSAVTLANLRPVGTQPGVREKLMMVVRTGSRPVAIVWRKQESA